MKLLNYTTSYFAAIVLLVIPIWAGIFYYAMLDEIYDSIDDGLDNRKGLIISRAPTDSSILERLYFDEGDYRITEIPPTPARNFKDVYLDTLMYMQNEQDFEPVRLLRTVFLQNGRYYRIDVITSMVEEDDLVSELLIALLLLYSGLLVTILIVNNVVLKKAWRPFYKLLEQLKQFRLERPVPLPEGKIKVEEFQLLHTTIGKMLRGVTESYESQKQFIENAAHELQTPLAISINKLESVLASEQLTNEAQAQVTGALDNLERLAGLNRSLLFLSRVENRQFSETENVQINRLTEQLIADFEDQLAYKHITLRQDTGGSCVVRMNAGLAAILLANLIKNALVHNHTGGNIEVTIADKSWSVSNTGRKRPLDQQQIFTRFYKTDSSSSSTGLGLSIVKAIADLYGFRVVYSHDTMHRFTIHF